MKRLFCLTFALFSLFAVLPAGAVFADVEGEETALAAETLAGLGILTGTGENAFSPDRTLTRAETCALLVRAMGLEEQVESHARRTLYADVPAGAWYSGHVNLAGSEKVMSGYGDGTFGPDDPVTFAQYTTILLRLLGYTAAEIGGVWPDDSLDFAKKLGITEGVALAADRPLSRGEAALLLFRTLFETKYGTGRPFYESIAGVATVEEAILLAVDAERGGEHGLAMVCLPEGGITWYRQATPLSELLTGRVVQLLLDGSGAVMGVIPESGGTGELEIRSATAGGLTGADGSRRRIPSTALVIAGDAAERYTAGGYLKVAARKGETVRLFFDEDGAVTHLVLSSGTDADTAVAIADAAPAYTAFAQALSLPEGVSITKNNAPATAADLAKNDVGYYDAAAGTLRVSDRRVTGFLTAASPSLAAAETVTIQGAELPVLAGAWDSLKDCGIGDRVTLLLTDDNKVAAASHSGSFSPSMPAILATDGRSVTLCDSGITLKADTITCRPEAKGSLVLVTATDASELRCTAPTETSGVVDLRAGTVDGHSLAPAVRACEWIGSGHVYSLEGEQGQTSPDLTALAGLDRVAASGVSWYRLNGAGQVDLLLLKDVTGSCYRYGAITTYPAEEGVGTGGDKNPAASLENSGGISARLLFTVSSPNTRYVGMATASTEYGFDRILRLRPLERVSVSADNFVLSGDTWQIRAGDRILSVSQSVEIHMTGPDLWLSGSDSLTALLDGSHDLTAWVDTTGKTLAQVRILQATPR